MIVDLKLCNRTTTGKVGEAYTTQQKDIPDYVFEKVEGQPTGKYTAESQVVTYVYKQMTADIPEVPVLDGKVTAKYVDESGKVLAPDEVTTGKVGEAYTTQQKDIPDYVFEKVEGQPTGKYTAEAQVVTYVYKQMTIDTPVANHKGNKENREKKDIKHSTHTTLPKTGEKNEKISYIIGIGILLLVSCSFILKKRKKRV